ncbi:hypothetical protein C8R43DRAFT_1127375 [Mycena crocata]|nr:hypothetical protein C8R43DRAFT_953599 [Mycena crocata]KAJ7152308.1 hypothetical protein C8R43DRAFT_1127375 [Mycena crocata]
MSLENSPASQNSQWFETEELQGVPRVKRFWQAVRAMVIAAFHWAFAKLSYTWSRSWGYKILQKIRANPLEAGFCFLILLVLLSVIGVIAWRVKVAEDYIFPIAPGPSYPSQDT